MEEMDARVYYEHYWITYEMIWSGGEFKRRLVIDQDNPRRNWKIGRIVAVHADGDGLVRVVDVKVGECTYRRSTSRISRLELEARQKIKLTLYVK